ncbi:hypothetical protein H6G97_45105 [Nostoc flagelliforme FACHB-838]|uniref:EF-hand domain-containing protein n=1 Tax=Nostoc flagelliforme FACHB-838 TaxID=2692904 RepID=A0ABR8E3A0_9NOSO|nr:hypothetical protein [Nostoc flagelliforme]MBD2536116.1 hypothetical protein [Nostoc flagelliforme FACHB-838]
MLSIVLRAFKHQIPVNTTMQDDLSSQIQDAKTDETELNLVLKKYDLDEELALEFSEIDKAFRQLEIKYQSLLNTRKFFNNGKN